MYFYLIEFPIDVILMLVCCFIYVHGSYCLFSCVYTLVGIWVILISISVILLLYIYLLFIYYYPYQIYIYILIIEVRNIIMDCLYDSQNSMHNRLTTIIIDIIFNTIVDVVILAVIETTNTIIITIFHITFFLYYLDIYIYTV